MSIDLGRIMGITINVNGEFEHEEEYKFISYSNFESKLKDIISLWKPHLILIPYPTRFYRVILAHAKLMGIVCLLGDKNNITVIEVQDATCKKVVLGDGKAKKEDIKNHFNTDLSEHILDSMMFTLWFIKEQKRLGK